MRGLRLTRAALRISALSTLLLVTQPSAGSADAPTVHLSLDACPSLAADRVRNILGAELGGLLIASDGDASTATTTVTVACEGTTTTLTVRDPSSGASLVRQVALDVVHPLARERLVAIAIAELITAMGIEIEPESQEEPEPVVEAPAPPEPVVEVVAPASSPPSRTLRLSALATARLLALPARGAYGARLRIEHAPRGRFGWAASLFGDRGDVNTEIGHVTAGAIGLNAELTLSMQRGMLTLTGAVGGTFALAVLRGHADAERTDVHPHTLRAPIFAPHCAARVLLHPTRRLFFVIGAEFSYVTVTAHALVDDARTVSFQGPTLSGELGFGVEL